MIKPIILAILALTVCSSIFITPAYPPNAFHNQFYTVNFRIRGIDFPSCKFTGLPEGLKAESDGTISGVPAQVGSHSIKLVYTAGEQKGEHEFILRILENTSQENSIVASTHTAVGLVISFPDNLIFRVGQKISLKLKATQGVQPYVWAFLNLPEGFVSNEKTGELQGYLKQAGYYNLNIEVADKEGKSASAFLTIKAQSISSLKTEQTLQVEIQNTQSQANLVLIEKEQVESEKSLFNALDLVNQRKNNVNEKKQLLAVQTLRQQNANISYTAAQQAYNQASQARLNSQQDLSVLLNTLNAAKQNFELASIEGTSASKTFDESRSAFEVAEKRFNIAQKAYNDAENAYKEAKSKFSDAQAALRDANVAKNFAFDEYVAAALGLEDARNQLEDARRRKSLADLAVQSAKDTLDLAIQARDDAKNELAKADDILAKAENIVNAALAKVADLREKYNISQKQLNAQQWDFDLKLNQLYTAQARKQVADRSSAIALAEGSLSDHNQASGVNIIGSYTTFSQAVESPSYTPKPVPFVGCKASTYPSIVGTSQIKSISTNGYTLASGHEILCGSCSQVDQVKIGDWVSYNGVIVNSVVNAARIQRVLFS